MDVWMDRYVDVAASAQKTAVSESPKITSRGDYHGHALSTYIYTEIYTVDGYMQWTDRSVGVAASAQRTAVSETYCTSRATFPLSA